MFNPRGHRPSPLSPALGCTVAIWLAIAGSARAETITVPIPGLLATYSATEIGERVTSVVLEVDPSEIVSVSLHLAGSVHVGITSCIPLNGTGWVDYPLGVDVNAYVHDPIHDRYLMASFPAPGVEPLLMDTAVPFDRTGMFHGHGDAAWQSVATGPFDLDLAALPMPTILDCDWVLVPRTTVDLAELIVETQGRVPGVESAWGAVKALYR